MSAAQLCVLNCIRLTKLVPVLFVFGVIGWSYYAYVYVLCFTNVDQWVKRVIFLVLYHVILVMFVWSYMKTVLTPISKPPHEFYLRETDIYEMELSQNELEAKLMLEKKARDLPLLTRTQNGNIRFCDKCKCIKPDRAHHCSVCKTCVLKMDHHCPWVNNCVGQSNYKYFILFLAYAVIFCIFIATTSVEFFIQFWSEIQSLQIGKFHLLFLFFVSTMFGISIFSLLSYHLYLISKNRTTLETFRPAVFQSNGAPDKNGFNISRLENFKQIFGNGLVKAFLPIRTSNLENEVNYRDLLSHKRKNFIESRNKAMATTLSNSKKSSSSYNPKILNNIKFSILTKQNHISPQRTGQFYFFTEKIHQASNTDFLTSLDITREVKLPKEDESISKKASVNFSSSLDDDSNENSLLTCLNTKYSAVNRLTFATVFNSETHDENNKSGMVEAANYPLSIQQLELSSFNENNARFTTNSSNSLLSNNNTSEHVEISMNNK